MENRGKNLRSPLIYGMLALIVTIVIVNTSVRLHNYFNLKSKCQKQVQYIPTRSATEGLFGRPSEDAHFSWGGDKFESREAAENGCMRLKKLK